MLVWAWAGAFVEFGVLVCACEGVVVALLAGAVVLLVCACDGAADVLEGVVWVAVVLDGADWLVVAPAPVVALGVWFWAELLGGVACVEDGVVAGGCVAEEDADGAVDVEVCADGVVGLVDEPLGLWAEAAVPKIRLRAVVTMKRLFISSSL